MDRPIPTPAPRLPKKKISSSRSAGEYVITHISPQSVIHNKSEQVLIVFNQTLPSNVEFSVVFTGLQTEKQSKAAASKIGDNVLSLRAPDHYPPEETKLVVHHGTHAAKLASYIRPFSFHSNLQQIQNTLLTVSDPVEFMCAALHLRQKSNVALDFELEKQFRKNVPPNFDLLAADMKERIHHVATVSPNPTLLHFAARYDLLKLSISIIEFPGGIEALNTANIDGMMPSDIANSCGHENLAAVLADAQQNPNRIEEIYEIMQDPIYSDYESLLRKSSDEIYVEMTCRDDDDIYCPMSGLVEPESIYQNTEELKDSRVENGGPGYDTVRSPGSLRPKMSMEFDRRSVHSISSTSSSESNNSGGSGDNRRPGLPHPRNHRSTGEPELRERINQLTHSKSAPKRRSSQFAEGNVAPQRPEQGNAPPLPPPKNPNIN